MRENKKEIYLQAVMAVNEWNGNKTKAAEALGIPFSTLWDRYNLGMELLRSRETEEEKKAEISNDKNGDKVLKTTDPRIQSVDDLMDITNVDRNIWKVDKQIVNTWGSEKNPNYQFKAWLKRKIPSYAEKAYDNFLRRAKEHMPKYEKMKYEPIENPHLLVLSLPDPHFGMLAWEEECGENYDTNIASALYEEASLELLRRANGFPVDRIVVEMGGDIFHMNDDTNRTPRGKNEIDTDGRLAKVFDRAMMTYRRCIDQLRMVAPVDVKWVPGNHDPRSSYYLATNIDTWYRNDVYVSVDRTPFPRKYYKYGKNMIGLTHGNEEKWSELPSIMAGEAPTLWGSTCFREWHLGHFHKKKKMMVTIGDEMGAGVYIKGIRSLAAKDDWHNRKGYKSMRAGEAFIYNKEIGPIGEFTVNIVNGEVQKV